MWQNLQRDLGEESFLESKPDYHYLAILNKTPIGNYLYCPYGPCFNNRKAFEDSLKSLKKLASTHNAIFIRVEPQSANFAKFAPKNAVKTKDLNPKETWLLDLTGPDEELKNKLPSRLLRYYKSASKKGITIETSKNPADIKYLLKLQKALASEKGINTFSEEYLMTELKQPFATLYLVSKHDDPNISTDNQSTSQASHQTGSSKRERCSDVVSQAKIDSKDSFKNIIAAGLVFDDDKTRYNLQGAQSDEGRKLHATGILTIQLILDAKKKGLNTFDFWGIAPEGASPNHPWAGFTNFKKTFAGYEEDYAGTYDLVLNPLKYKLYTSIRKLNRIIRK